MGRFPFLANGKALALGETEGFVKTVFDARTGELLGAHMIGGEVTELIQGFAIARSLETTEAELMRTVFAHPDALGGDARGRARRLRTRAQRLKRLIRAQPPRRDTPQAGGVHRDPGPDKVPAPSGRKDGVKRRRASAAAAWDAAAGPDRAAPREEQTRREPETQSQCPTPGVVPAGSNGCRKELPMRDRRTWTVLLAGLAWLCLSSGGAPPLGLARLAQPTRVGAEAPWTPEVPAIESALRELGAPLLPLGGRPRRPHAGRRGPSRRPSRRSSCWP